MSINSACKFINCTLNDYEEYLKNTLYIQNCTFPGNEFIIVRKSIRESRMQILIRFNESALSSDYFR